MWETHCFQGKERSQSHNLQTCHIDGLAQDCSISIAKYLEILQSCTKPLLLGSMLKWKPCVYHAACQLCLTEIWYPSYGKWNGLMDPTSSIICVAEAGRLGMDMSLQPIITEMEMSSFWWNFHHSLHKKLSFWQLPVQPKMEIFQNEGHFRFNYPHLRYQFLTYK